MLTHILDIIGILGFLMSVMNAIYFLMKNRKKIIVYFGNYGIQKNHSFFDLLNINYRFDNLSQTPISITRIRLFINDTYYDSEPRERIVEEFSKSRNNEVYYRDYLKSNILPINLDSLASNSGYLSFAIPKDILSTDEKFLTFQICTNRGKAIQKTFSLHEDTVYP